MNKNLSQSSSALQSIQNSSQNEIILYRPNDAISLEVRLENETVWLNRQQIAELFGRDIKTIVKYINNALKEELANFLVVANICDNQEIWIDRRFADYDQKVGTHGSCVREAFTS